MKGLLTNGYYMYCLYAGNTDYNLKEMTNFFDIEVNIHLIEVVAISK